MTTEIADLGQAIAARERKALDAKDRWTPREALAAALADIDAGELKPEAICVVYAVEADGGLASRVGRYVGSVGVTGKKESFWVIGMVQRAISDWLGGT